MRGLALSLVGMLQFTRHQIFVYHDSPSSSTNPPSFLLLINQLSAFLVWTKSMDKLGVQGVGRSLQQVVCHNIIPLTRTCIMYRARRFPTRGSRAGYTLHSLVTFSRPRSSYFLTLRSANSSTPAANRNDVAIL
jgi:hypothetical protein